MQLRLNHGTRLEVSARDSVQIPRLSRHFIADLPNLSLKEFIYPKY